MSSTQGTNNRYSKVAIILHWIIAALILANLTVGYFMEGLPGDLRRTIIGFHISSGMTILTLTVVRVVWRLTHQPPPYAASMQPWERHAAALAHFSLYAVMVLMPLTGWALLSSNPPIGSAGAAAVAAARAAAATASGAAPRQQRSSPRMIWGTIPLPSIKVFENIGATPEGVSLQKAVHDEFVDWHTIGSYLTIALLLLHIAGALKHQLVDRHAEFARMGIGSARQNNEP